MIKFDKYLVVIGVMSLIISAQVSYAYHSEYSKMKLENVQIQSEMKEMKATEQSKEKMLHDILPGTKITGTDIEKFKSLFKDYNVKLLDETGDTPLEEIDSNRIYTVTHVMKTKNAYEYEFKLVEETDKE